MPPEDDKSGIREKSSRSSSEILTIDEKLETWELSKFTGDRSSTAKRGLLRPNVGYWRPLIDLVRELSSVIKTTTGNCYAGFS